MNESDEDKEKPVKKDWLAVFHGMGYKWEGGKKDTAPGCEIDSYIPTNKSVIASLLLPLELAVNKGCYHSNKGRAVASFTAEKLVDRGLPVLVRYLNKIHNCYAWA